MKRFLSLLIFFTVLFETGLAQEWTAAKSFGTCEGHVYFNAVEPTTMGYIIGGSLFGPSLEIGNYNLTANSQYDMVLAGLSPELDVEWAFNLSAQGGADVIAITTDQLGNMYVAVNFWGLYFIVNQDTIFNVGDTDAVLMKFNAAREIDWVQHFGTMFQDGAQVLISDDNNFIYFSWSTVDFDNNFEQEIIKLNGSGETIWSKQLQPASIQKVLLTNDNQLLLAGSFESEMIISDGVQFDNPDDRTSVFLLYYNLDGSHRNTEIIADYLLFHDLTLHKDDLVILGWKKDTGHEVYDFITKYDSIMNEVWSQPLFSCSSEPYYSDFYSKLLITESGTIIVAGTSESEYVCFGEKRIDNIPPYPGFVLSQTSRVFISEFDSEGLPLGIKAFGSDLRNSNVALTKGADGNLLILGNFKSFELNFGDLIAENTCPIDTMRFPIHGHLYLDKSTFAYAAVFNGRIVSTSKETLHENTFLLHPNPSQDHFFLRSEAFAVNPVQIQIFATDGKLLSQQNLLPNGNSLRVETGTLPPGMYIANIIVDQQLIAQRFVKY